MMTNAREQADDSIWRCHTVRLNGTWVVLCLLAAISLGIRGIENNQRGAQPQDTPARQAAEGEGPGPPLVSMVAILADPERFNHQEVVVTGFISIDRSYVVLALDRDTLTYGILPNSMVVDTSKCANAEEFSREAKGCCCLRGVVLSKRLDQVTGRVRPTLLLHKFEYRLQGRAY
jgi:hypothetical protein